MSSTVNKNLEQNNGRKFWSSKSTKHFTKTDSEKKKTTTVIDQICLYLYVNCNCHSCKRKKFVQVVFFLNGSTFYLAELANWFPCGISLGLADKVFDVHLHVLQRVMGSQFFCFTRRRATFHLNYGHTLVTCSLHLQALCVIIAWIPFPTGRSVWILFP